MRRATLIVAIAAALGAGCGGDPAKRPVPPASRGVEALIAALRSPDPDPAYQLLSAELRARLSYEDFAREWQKSGPERTAQAAYLEEELEQQSAFGEHARLTYDDGKTVYLTREKSFWRMEAPVVSSQHAGRPHDAVIFFARALAERDVEAVLALLTERRREGIGTQLQSFVESLEERLASPDNEVELIGDDRAEMRWDDGRKRYKLILRKEGEEWRIDDIQLQPTPTDPEDE